MNDTKPQLRAAMRARRAAFAAGRTDRFDVMAPLDALPIGGIVASYRPLGSEIDPAPIEARVRAVGGRIVWPRVESLGVMRFLAADTAADWEEGPYGIVQPRSRCPALVPALLLVPLLAFDRRGGRLGQGGGYYDRALAALPTARTLGVAWSVQEVPMVPTDPWDMLLDAIVTECEWIVP